MSASDHVAPPADLARPAGNVIDDAPLTSFHRKLTIFCSGGPFLDGFALGVIGFALPQIATQWSLGGVWQGFLAAAPLLGAPAVVGIGYLTDRLGRRIMYVADIAAITLLAVAQFFVTGPVQLLILRILLGIAIGADYPIASSLLTEFAPRAARARLVGLQTIMWSAGNAMAFIVGAGLLQLGSEAWRWILLSPAVIGIALALMRIGTPESPRWLISKGRSDEALAVLQKVYGPSATLDGIGEDAAPTRFRMVFEAPYLRRTVFVALFWACSIAPVYAIYAFAPKLLDAFHLTDGGAVDIGSVLIGVFFLVGTILASVVADRWPRRVLLIWPFVIASVSLLALGVFAEAAAIMVVVLFGIYALAIGGPTILQWIYPNEIFPTEIRATAFSIGLSASRVGAIIGTFAVPLLLDNAGIGTTMIIVGLISGAGAAVSIAMAPETHGRPLSAAAS